MTPSSIIFNNFFPFLQKFNVEDIQHALDFDFNSIGIAELTAVTFQRGSRHDYMIFFVPEKSGIKIPFPPLQASVESLKANLLFFGYPVDNIITKKGGVKNLSAPGDAYVKNKIMVTMANGEGVKFYFVIPEYFCAALFRFCAVIFDGASDIEKPLLDIADELTVIDYSILHSNNRLFVKYYTLLRRIEDPIEAALFISSLLESGFIGYNHLASLKFYYNDFSGMIEYLSKNNLSIVNNIYAELKDFIEKNKKEAALWKGVMDYQFHNVISSTIFSGTVDMPEPFLSKMITIMDSSIIATRNGFAERCFPYAELIDYFVGKNNAAFLIDSGVKKLLVSLAAFGFKADFDKLFKLFGAEFKNDFTDDLRSINRSFSNISSEKYSAMASDTMMRFRKNAEEFIMSSIIKKRSPMGLKELYERALVLRQEAAVILYNRAGYEKFVSLFEAFRYSKYSPVSKKESDAVFDSVVSLLPYVERTICRDIYYEEINRDRVINENAHERAVKDISHFLMSMDEMIYRGEQ